MCYRIVYISKYQLISSSSSRAHNKNLLRKKLVETKKLAYLKKLHVALDEIPYPDTHSSYTDFSKAFDKVPHVEFLEKLIKFWSWKMSTESLLRLFGIRKVIYQSGQGQFTDT